MLTLKSALYKNNSNGYPRKLNCLTVQGREYIVAMIRLFRTLYFKGGVPPRPYLRVISCG